MKRTSVLVGAFLGLLACPLADNLRAMDQLIVGVADGFVRSGQVADAETRVPLSGAIVELPELGVRVISDESGRVDFGRLPTGPHRLTAERVGYDAIRRGELPVPWDEDFLILLDRDPDYDPEAPGRIVGRVTEEGRRNRGVSDVEVTLLGPARPGTVTDGRGRFDLTDLEPGSVEVQFTHLGYAPRTTAVIVQPGRTTEINASMSMQPIELEAIEVTVRSRWLEQNGFYRRSLAWGRQYTRADLDKINPTYLSDIFWRVPGVNVRYGFGGAQVVSTRGRSFRSPGGCPMTVYLDGVDMWGADIDNVDPESLEAMEIFRGMSIPVRYRFYGGCGVVLLWTRR